MAGAGGSGSHVEAVPLGAPICVFSVLKFKADDPPWMLGEPDEVPRTPPALPLLLPPHLDSLPALLEPGPGYKPVRPMR
jgi:hypothetical protein